MSSLADYPTNLKDLAKGRQDQPLICSGCAHSAADAPFPGHPSGERPCFFCTRNVQREAWCAEHLAECDGTYQYEGEALPCHHPAHGKWYDGSSALKVPMDCYRSTDMVRQEHFWQGGDPSATILG